MNGPVPVGCSVAYSGKTKPSPWVCTLSASYSSSAVGLWMAYADWPSTVGNLLVTRVTVTSAVSSSITSQDSYRLSVSVPAKPPKSAFQ